MVKNTGQERWEWRAAANRIYNKQKNEEQIITFTVMTGVSIAHF